MKWLQCTCLQKTHAIVLVYIQLVYFVFIDKVRLMANVILPFVVSRGTPNVPATNLVTADYGPFTNEKDSGIASKTQKPLQLNSLRLSK